MEWNIYGGDIWYEDGTEIVNFKNNNLHIMGYSIPINEWLELDNLQEYLYTEPKQPYVIPYVTSYYKPNFGFCMSENQRKKLKPGWYHIKIDSDMKEGFLTRGEILLPGKSTKEILISSYTCNPSMANDNVSGITVAVFLAKLIKEMGDREYTYRIILGPETIGSIAFLSENNKHLKENLIAGYILSCIGDDFNYSYVPSKYGNTLADKVLKYVLSREIGKYNEYSYLERGSDERQFNSSGIDLPVCCFCRGKFYEFDEYHTSRDNMDYISPEGLEGSFSIMAKCIRLLEYNSKWKANVICELQLGKRGLYPDISRKRGVQL